MGSIEKTYAQITEAASRATVSKTYTRVRHLFCIVAEHDPSQIEPMMKEVSKRIIAQNGTVISLLPPLVFATFGFPDDTRPDLDAKLSAAVQDIMQALSNNVKLVYGVTPAFYGILDCAQIQQFGVILPEMQQRLKRLVDLSYGQAIRYD